MGKTPLGRFRRCSDTSSQGYPITLVPDLPVLTPIFTHGPLLGDGPLQTQGVRFASLWW